MQLLATDDLRFADAHQVVGVNIVGTQIGEARIEQPRPVIGQNPALLDGQRLARFVAVNGTQRRFGRDPDLAAVGREEGGEGALATLVIGVGAEIVEVHARVERRVEQPNGLPAHQRRPAAENEVAAHEIRPAELAVGHAAPLVAVDQAVGRRVLGLRRCGGRRGSGGGGGLDECPAVHLVRRGHGATLRLDDPGTITSYHSRLDGRITSTFAAFRRVGVSVRDSQSARGRATAPDLKAGPETVAPVNTLLKSTRETPQEVRPS